MSDESFFNFLLNCDHTSSFSTSSLFISTVFSCCSSRFAIECDENSTDVRRDFK